MKYIILCLILINIDLNIQAQSNKDSSVTIKVFGNCIQCKIRIEAALKTRGIDSAVLLKGLCWKKTKKETLNH